MTWDEALEALGEGKTVKLPNKPSGLRVEMGTYIEVWEDGREMILHTDIRKDLLESDEWEVAEW